MIREWLRKLFSRRAPNRAEDAELDAFRVRFKQRFKSFRRLLFANKNALVLMNELEEALDGTRPVSMAFIRSRSTRITVDVLQILRSLNTIAPKKYEALFTRFNQIQSQLNHIVTYQADASNQPLVIRLKEAGLENAEQVGGKMAALGEMTRIEEIRIPDGFVVTAGAYHQFMDESGLRDDINRIIQAAEPQENQDFNAVSTKIHERIMSAKLPDGVREAIAEHTTDLLRRSNSKPLLAFRSSALGEDGEEMSFAGQYRSVLNVQPDDIFDAYKQVVSSKYSAQAMSYRLHYGILDDETAMCVGCMPMIDARFGGVIYTKNPLDDTDSSVYIYAADGLPAQVVNGSGHVNTFVVKRDTPLEEITQREDTSASGIDDDFILKIAEASLRIEKHFQRAQDIEWVSKPDDQIVFLQSRPLTKKYEKQNRTSQIAPKSIRLSGGVTASRGRAAGPVFIARTPREMDGFVNGSVLVTSQPLPVWATLLDRVSAVVSEQGSAACHLANVAREYGIPAILALRGAVSQLKHGEMITVDADERMICAGRQGHLSDPSAAKRPPLKESPIYRTLHAVAKHIIPLRLIDPRDSGFTPEACETLHDITRFCHEMAVKEMFQFSIDSHIPRGSARRLFTDVATQFWIIDLEGGIVEEANDPYFVTLDQVKSTPMLAIWRGIKAEVWKGPPPINAGGIMDLMLKSTMDPNLNPSMRSDYSRGNHFMISENYCSLQARFGYHFATVEALVTSHVNENFISFQFGGGGTSEARQKRRARLVEELLVQRDFQTERKGDFVAAQKGGYTSDVMEKSLEAIGYLLVHTRQLDMAMTDEKSFEKYKNKLEQGLKSAGF